jgi:hypothetical protein
MLFNNQLLAWLRGLISDWEHNAVISNPASLHRRTYVGWCILKNRNFSNSFLKFKNKKINFSDRLLRAQVLRAVERREDLRLHERHVRFQVQHQAKF